MRRRIVSWVVFAVLCVCSHLALAEEKPTPAFQVLPPDVLVFGDVGMIPLTPLAELTGATLTEDVLTHTITLARKEQSFTCTWHQTTALQNGKPIELAKAPFPRHHVTYAPLRQCVEALGGTVKMDEENHLAAISLPGMETALYCSIVSQDIGSDAFWDNDTELYLVNLDGTGSRRLTYTCTDEEYPKFFPDGKLLIYVAAGGVAYLDTTTQVQGYMAPQKSGENLIYFSDPKISHDGTLILFELFGYADNSVHIGLFSGNEGMRDLGPGTHPCLSPDGKLIAYTKNDSKVKLPEVHLMDTNGKDVKKLGEGFVDSFSPDGSYLVATRNYGDSKDYWGGLDIYKLKKTKVEKVYELPSAERKSGEEFGGFSPDGAKIVFTRTDGVYVMNPDRSQLQQLRKCVSRVDFATFTPDGERILFAESGGWYSSKNHLYIMNADGSKLKLLMPLGDGFHFLHYAFTPDGTQVLLEAYQH